MMREQISGGSADPARATPGSIKPALPSRDFEVLRCSDGDTLTLKLRGELDMAGVPVLDRELEDPASRRCGRLVIDLRELEFMDSSGLHCLVRAQLAGEAIDRRLSLKIGSGNIRRLFELTGALEQFTFED